MMQTGLVQVVDAGILRRIGPRHPHVDDGIVVIDGLIGRKGWWHDGRVGDRGEARPSEGQGGQKAFIHSISYVAARPNLAGEFDRAPFISKGLSFLIGMEMLTTLAVAPSMSCR